MERKKGRKTKKKNLINKLFLYITSKKNYLVLTFSYKDQII